MSIFKAYDIRGIYPDELNEEIIKKIARAFITKTKTKKIVVGHDQRPHSPPLVHALVNTLLKTGAEIIDIGLSTTPMFYFAVSHLKAEAGIMVTASHNPSKYNGMKMTLHDAIPIGGQDIQELKNIIDENQFMAMDKKGEIIEKNIFDNYKEKILSFAEIKRPLKVVIDTGNGMCGLTIPKIFKDLSLETTYLYQEIDLSFPNHEANPLKLETLQDLQEEVKKQNAHLGLAFDGDGDRAGFIDEQGHVIPMDLITALIADQMPSQKIVYDVRSSKIVKEIVQENNSIPIPSKVGHYFIKKVMREKDAAFGGEVSGHYYFKELSYTDSAVLAAIKVLNILSQSELPFSQLIKKYQKYHKINETNFEVKDKDAKIKEIQDHYKDAKISHLDGITVEYDDWWFNLRKSNTEPLIRLNLEANSEELIKQKTQELIKLIKH
ncbi:MAG: phosphomannomutase/phosphoglucomutase [Nanoarchaeota archaeon]|nr:phosphomannomutase/phosphoglucomutase [Nanoarchaeota archaeon]